MSRAVIATHNLAKAKEMLRILGPALPGTEFVTLADFPDAEEPEETGATYAENAAIKAGAASQATGLLAIADDAGLEIDALQGAPGLFSKRYAGENTAFPEKIRLILADLATIPHEERAARFRCAVAIAEPGGTTHHFESTCEGQIAREPAGEGGFGYDPIFYLPHLGRTMAQLSAREKDEVSHRGKVLAQVVQWLRSYRVGS